MTLPNLAILEKKCAALGLEVKPAGKKLGKADCVRVLREHFLPEGGLPYQELTHMLAFAIWNLKDDEQAKVWKSPTWGAQVKLNGCRIATHFVKGVGVFSHSRTVSVKTYRYEDLSAQFVYHDYIPDFSATVDLEAMCEKSVDTSNYTSGKGSVTKTALHSSIALLHLEAEASRRLQKEQDAFLMSHVFDITSWEGQDLRKMRLKDRETFRGKFQQKMATIPELASFFHFPVLEMENKKAVFDRIIALGGEGVILKNINEIYADSSSRGRDAWVKVKKRQEYDAFVSGFKPGEPDSGWVDLVGALEFSVNLKEGGTHVIGFASNLPLETRKKVTVMVDGKPTLHPSVYKRVAEISGQDISSREMRLSHCTLDRWRSKDGADAKSAEDCVVSKEDLLSASEWVA